MTLTQDRLDTIDRHHTLEPSFRYDPLDDDCPHDERLELTRRGLLRVAVAAARTGARYERDGLEGDPVAWMLAPRNVFDGETALDACVDLAPLRRCIALHAPSADRGLDADPEEMDEILGELVREEVSASDGRRRRGSSRPGSSPFFSPESMPRSASGPQLFSCSLMRYEPGARVMTFVAGVAPDERDFRRRLFERFGAMAALTPDVRIGFDQYDPVAVALVSERVTDWLTVVAAEPGRSGFGGFDVVVEHRTVA